MALPNRYPLPTVMKNQTYMTDEGRVLSFRVKAINWTYIIDAMKLREMERRCFQDELTYWLKQ
jgi:hypothetical protein